MVIRFMTESDYDAVDRLMKQVHELHVLNRPDLYIPMEHPYSKEEFANLVQNENVSALLAEEDNQVVGICFISMRTKTGMVKKITAYMDDLCVDAGYRGEGIGKALFLKAEQIVKEKGAERLDLMVWNFNDEAMRFYKSLGMVPQRYILEKML